MGLRVRLNVNFSEILVKLCQRHLQSGFRRIDHNRRSTLADNVFRYSELIFEHKLGQLKKYTVLSFENVVKRTACHIRKLKNFRIRRAFKALLNEELYTHGKDSPL